ncbi:hypothetical protein HK104_008371 [Borealophlyctis nickersoniae]|nr:hypothetical protein HK104_008371 [Borealophlyctis nickersoniae]
MGGPSPVDAASGPAIGNIARARKLFAYGDQDEYWDHPSTIGWVKRGEETHPVGCAVVLCAGNEGFKHMFVRDGKCGEEWVDVAGGRKEIVTIGEDGFADFWANGGSVSVWVRKSEAAEGYGWVAEKLKECHAEEESCER